ncbi:hypothetical protein [Agrobacterium sp. LAD9]|uniref:hypothetical protein n=1 Tax=Agrobacterium sp. LAD9 TaxID=2055153 RepID=UPI00129080BB|nr:hypothetical protein [Agrobacterium sp. LAD9]
MKTSIRQMKRRIGLMFAFGLNASTMPVSAHATVIANACGVPVHHALIEVGHHKPPQVFTPEEKNGRIEFNFLATATDPLTVMCFRTADEASLFRVPLPDGLTRCHFADAALSCRTDKAGIAPALPEQRSIASLPPPVAQAFLAWSEECGTTSQAVFSDDYLTIVDIDQDGDEDYILNGDGATCVTNGKVIARGGGNGGTSLKIFTRQGKAVTATLDLFTQSAKIYAHKGFAAVTTPDTSYRIASGKVSKVRSSKNGTVVYTLIR